MQDPTLIIHWVFTACAVIIMTTRLILKRIVFYSFDLADYLTIAALVCALARGGLIHVVLTWGTNNMTAAMRAKIVFTEQVIYRRTIGSKLTISNRPIYNTYLWLQKFVLFHFYVRHYRPNDVRNGWLMWIYIPVFVGSWIAAFIVGFTECDPFHLYWQVVPNPGTCVRAQIQLIVLGAVNIVTDAMLLVLPIPTLINLKVSKGLKLRLYLLCALGGVIIAVTVVRLPINHFNAAIQSNRTTWASTELFVAALVANAPILYGAFRKLIRGSSNTTVNYATGSKRSPADTALSSETSKSTNLKFNQTPKVIWASAGPHNRLEEDEEPMFPIQGSSYASNEPGGRRTHERTGTITRTIDTNVHSYTPEQRERDGQAFEMTSRTRDFTGKIYK